MRGLLVETCVMLACAHQPRPPPLTGWRELRSAHFQLRTDLSPEAARVTLQSLEILRTALQSAWAQPAETPDTADVIVLGDATELLTFTDWLGLATTTGARPLVVTAAANPSVFEDELPRFGVLAHELTHVLERWRIPDAPAWFAEGLAGFLGTIEVLDGHHARFGRLAPIYLDLPLTSDGPEPVLPLDTLERMPWRFSSPDEARAAYRSAQLWVQVLRGREPSRMRTLEAKLQAGVPWRTAWAELRRSLDVNALADQIARFDLPVEVHAFVSPAVDAAERPMASWEVQVVLAELWMVGNAAEGGTERARRARAELQAAARAAPGEALPRVRLADLETDPDTRLALAEAIAREHPGSAEAAVFLARVLRDDGRDRAGRSTAIARAVALAPSDPDALTAQAVEEARRGDSAAALESARRAVRAAPWSPTVFRVEANLLAATGHCDEALEAVERALDVLPHRAPQLSRDTLVRDRALIRSQCPRRTGNLH